MSTATLSLPSTLELKIPLTDDQCFQLCQDNPNLRFERTVSGELLIMSLTGGETGNRNIELAFQLQAWSRQNNLGLAFDSSPVSNCPTEPIVLLMQPGFNEKNGMLYPPNNDSGFHPSVQILSSSYALPAIVWKRCGQKCKNISTMACAWAG